MKLCAIEAVRGATRINSRITLQDQHRRALQYAQVRERAHAGNTYTAATLTARGCPINVSIELRARPRECGQNAGDVQGAMEEIDVQESKN